MDEKAFKDRVQRLETVNKIIAKLDSAIRADAFQLPKSYITSGIEVPEPKTLVTPAGQAAWMPNTFPGSIRLRNPQRRRCRSGVLVWPIRLQRLPYQPTPESRGRSRPRCCPAITRDTGRSGKALFQTLGRGTFKPTVHGETFMKNTYAVTKGRKQPPVPGKEDA